MQITHTWKIRKLIQINDNSGTVIRVYFKVHSTDGTCYYVSGGNVELNVDNIVNFVPYEDLTEEIVIGWVHDKLGTSLGGYEQLNSDWINSAETPIIPETKTEGLPWEV